MATAILEERSIDPLEHDKEEFTKHLFETVRQPLLALDSGLRVRLANRCFYETFQVAPERTENRLIFELGTGQWNIPRLRRLLEVIVPSNESFEGFEVEHEFEHIGRKTMWLNARRVNDGRMILLAIEDVTERKRLEGELKSFAQVAAHDLKDPLRMVALHLSLLERQADRNDEKGAELIRLALDGTRRMNRLIDNLLTYSAAGRRAKISLVDLDLAFENAVSNLGPSISEAGAIVTKDRLPTVSGSATEFEQLFQNLIANGIKYRGAEPPAVHVSAKRDGKEWLLRVEDNGIGIAADDRKRIFDAFLRLHDSREYSGTGLGLSTVKKIVESLGGRIWVESAPGRGSVFFFTLPADE